ncbi:hypothetical protein ACPOL_6216 [Acidisarcina polymorpha]|uniref:Uncharacterized protein n=1 Tax=Acidisarcina polymorpha TaxID=2211140 RepID=A0A2Z5G911_9BACT|nr:hypothetical protein ACPOL_6216 [Acidisarcina polymorpha]
MQQKRQLNEPELRDAASLIADKANQGALTIDHTDLILRGSREEPHARTDNFTGQSFI